MTATKPELGTVERAYADGYAAAQHEIARLRDEGPGTPSGRLKAIGEYAVAAGLCSGIEAKPAELFLIESHARLRAALEPFAKAADELSSFSDETRLDLAPITLGDLRRARKALAEQKE